MKCLSARNDAIIAKYFLDSNFGHEIDEFRTCEMEKLALGLVFVLSSFSAPSWGGQTFYGILSVVK